MMHDSTKEDETQMSIGSFSTNRKICWKINFPTNWKIVQVLERQCALPENESILISYLGWFIRVPANKNTATNGLDQPEPSAFLDTPCRQRSLILLRYSWIRKEVPCSTCLVNKVLVDVRDAIMIAQMSSISDRDFFSRTVYRSRQVHPCVSIPEYPFLSFVLTDRNTSPPPPTVEQNVLFDHFSFVSLSVQVRSITDEVCRTSLRPCHSRMEFSVHSLRRHERPSRSSSDQSRAIRRRKWPSSPRTVFPTCRRTFLSSRRSFFAERSVSAWTF